VEKVAEFWTEEEVLAFKPRLDKRYGVFVKRKLIPLHEFQAGRRDQREAREPISGAAPS
jgi:hypothetical protein